VPWSSTHPVPRELTIPEIRDIVAAFGMAAARVKRAGFGLVEIHGAHGYLITNFLSSYSNLRQDEYGGSRENPLRFALEVVAAVRNAVGADYPVSFRLNGEDWTGLGNQIEEQVEVARTLARAGVNLIHVSGRGLMQGADKQIAPMYVPRGSCRRAAAAIRRAVGIPVIVCGSMSNPADAAEAIASGDVDLVASARQFLADPNWPAKIASGRPQEITVSPLVEAGLDIQTDRYQWLARGLDERGVRRLSGARFRAVGEGEVLIEDESGRLQSLRTEWVIWEPDRRPNNELAERLAEAGVPHVVVGDSLEVGDLRGAVHGGTAAALRI
jgi:2,4-dienoyl-CoA reductase-like NADH-dependent reductase (Old Yellow Enzyme family)